MQEFCFIYEVLDGYLTELYVLKTFEELYKIQLCFTCPYTSSFKLTLQALLIIYLFLKQQIIAYFHDPSLYQKNTYWILPRCLIVNGSNIMMFHVRSAGRAYSLRFFSNLNSKYKSIV